MEIDLKELNKVSINEIHEQLRVETDAEKWVNNVVIKHIDLLNKTDFCVFILLPLSKKRGYKKLVKQFTDINSGRIRYCLGTKNEGNTLCEFHVCFGKDVNLLGKANNEYTTDMAMEILEMVQALAFPINGFLHNYETETT